MRKLMIAVAALLVVSPAAANNSPVEKVVTYYLDFYTPIGESTYYCDGTIVTTGMVTAETTEVYYGCP